MQRVIRRSLRGAALVILFTLASPAFAQDANRSIRRGERLVTSQCSMCHAIGTQGTSPHSKAPAFRTLFKRYPLESLVESLSEGLTSGHPEMPTFVFSPNDADAILSYLESIQQP